MAKQDAKRIDEKKLFSWGRLFLPPRWQASPEREFAIRQGKKGTSQSMPPPPPYEEHIHTTSVPREDQLRILTIVDGVMEDVDERVVALDENFINPLGTCNLIRESCAVSATAITKAALPGMTEEEATRVIERVHENFHRIGRALASITPTEQKVAVGTIWVNAVREVTKQAAADNRGYRVNAWVFATSAMANAAASTIMMELHYG